MHLLWNIYSLVWMFVFGIYMCTKGIGVHLVFTQQWNLVDFADVGFMCGPTISIYFCVFNKYRLFVAMWVFEFMEHMSVYSGRCGRLIVCTWKYTYRLHENSTIVEYTYWHCGITCVSVLGGSWGNCLYSWCCFRIDVGFSLCTCAQYICCAYFFCIV